LVTNTIEVPELGRLEPHTLLEAPPLRAATNSLKSGLFNLMRTSNCSWVNTTKLHCNSSLSGSSWSSRGLGSSSPIDSDGTTRSLAGSSIVVS
jgi:hypothetical protein